MSPLNRRVLCVEDNEDSAFMLSALLRQEGYEVRIATNVSETLRLVEDGAYDLFILDKKLLGKYKRDDAWRRHKS